MTIYHVNNRKFVADLPMYFGHEATPCGTVIIKGCRP